MDSKKLAVLTAQLEAQHQKTMAKLVDLRQELSMPADDDSEEQVADLMERELVLGRIRDLELQREVIERALQRVAQGTYGLCENCGQAIDPARLEFMPETTLCIHCKTTNEQLIQQKIRLSLAATA